MSYETEEQQLEVLKEWWKENGTPLIVGAVLGLAGFAGWKYWTEKQIAYQESASDHYNQVIVELTSEDKSALVEKANAVKTAFPDTSYAVLSAFQLAKSAVENNDLDKAASELKWIIEQHADNKMATLAKIRLARILIAQDKASEALTLVEVAEGSGYHSLASMVKGDALMALDQKDQALLAYKAASNDLTIAARHPSLQMQIDALSANSRFVISRAEETEASEESASSEQTETVDVQSTEGSI